MIQILTRFNLQISSKTWSCIHNAEWFYKICKEDISKVAKVVERRFKFYQDQFTNVMKNSYTKKINLGNQKDDVRTFCPPSWSLSLRPQTKTLVLFTLTSTVFHLVLDESMSHSSESEAKNETVEVNSSSSLRFRPTTSRPKK